MLLLLAYSSKTLLLKHCVSASGGCRGRKGRGRKISNAFGRHRHAPSCGSVYDSGREPTVLYSSAVQLAKNCRGYSCSSECAVYSRSGIRRRFADSARVDNGGPKESENAQCTTASYGCELPAAVRPPSPVVAAAERQLICSLPVLLSELQSEQAPMALLLLFSAKGTHSTR